MTQSGTTDVTKDVRCTSKFAFYKPYRKNIHTNINRLNKDNDFNWIHNQM